MCVVWWCVSVCALCVVFTLRVVCCHVRWVVCGECGVCGVCGVWHVVCCGLSVLGDVRWVLVLVCVFVCVVRVGVWVWV